MTCWTHNEGMAKCTSGAPFGRHGMQANTNNEMRHEIASRRCALNDSCLPRTHPRQRFENQRDVSGWTILRNSGSFQARRNFWCSQRKHTVLPYGFSPSFASEWAKKRDLIKNNVHHQGAITLWMVRCAPFVNVVFQFSEILFSKLKRSNFGKYAKRNEWTRPWNFAEHDFNEDRSSQPKVTLSIEAPIQPQ